MRMIKADQFSAAGQDLWQQVLDSLQKEYGEAISKSWFTHIKFQELVNQELILTVPSNFIRQWILNNYLASIQEFVLKLDPFIKNIDFRVQPNRAKPIDNDNEADGIVAQGAWGKCDIMGGNLDPRFTFVNFVCGDANKVAYTASKAIAEGEKFASDSNILYIQGAVGMGKTHLLQAVASHIRSSFKDKKVAYLSADRFIHLYVKSIRTNNLIEFKEKLREADVLILDDLQFICGKTGTQQEFLNTFSALTESNRKVIISCDVSPYQLNLDKRSISKLSGGLVTTIKSSDYKLRLEILEAKVRQMNFAVPMKVLELIAANITSSNRELEGALNKLITYSSLENKEMDIKAAQDILKDNLEAHNIEVSVEKVIETVANYYKVTPAEITSKSRAAKFVLPRQVSAYLSKQLTKFSLQDIGFKLGGRDHATIIYSVNKLEDRLPKDKAMGNDIAQLMESLSRPAL